MPRNDAEFNKACWGAGIRVEYAEDEDCYKMFMDENGNFLRLGRDGGKWILDADIIDYEAACLLRCKMLDDVFKAVMEIDINLIARVCFDRDALLEAWKEVCGG